MNKRILIITGDNLGLSREQIDYPDIEILKYPVLVDGNEYRQSAEYDAAWLVEKYVKEGVVAKSSSIIKGELIDVVEANKDRYDLIVHVVMSSVMSAATFAVAENVREMYKKTIPIINIDSRQLVTGVGNVLMGVIDIIKEHDDADDIVRLSQEIVHNTYSYMVVPDLNYLARGGRIGKAKALMGSVLRIIPILGLMGDDEEGIIVPLDRGRTFQQVNQKMIDLMKAKMAEKSATQIQRIILNDFGDNQEAVSDLKERLKSLPCKEMIHGKADLVAVVHCGPKAYFFAITV
ncbi:MAG: degV family protein [Bacteroidetes bacterium 38_7]|jgi:DegV family protein with EDD domain|nr:MAG: degV family protein [Bacteroidetes bacterium 38_7]HCC86115.1 fatty acid-binding protein DegV [Porphyromonadaceae bacterium]